MQKKGLKCIAIVFNCSILIDIQNLREDIIMTSYYLLNIIMNLYGLFVKSAAKYLSKNQTHHFYWQ
jgi:hypothetical protein